MLPAATDDDCEADGAVGFGREGGPPVQGLPVLNPAGRLDSELKTGIVLSGPHSKPSSSGLPVDLGSSGARLELGVPRLASRIH